MGKNILSLVLCGTMFFAMPAVSVASNMIEIVEAGDIETNGITISVNQNVLRVQGAQGQNLQIFNVAGVCVKNVNVAGDDVHYDLNLQKGCYIVKIGKVVRKISIK